MVVARLLLAVGALALVAACSSPQAQQRARQARAATAFLATQGSIGDPGRVAAADFAFAKMAREEGTWTAFRAYAAQDAVMDAPGSFAPVSTVLAGRGDPDEPLRWAPTDVWSSCDGTLAASLGRFLRPDGVVGDYVTIWRLQSDNSYKWIYDTGTPDDPQPTPEPAADIPEGAIVVPGLRALQGLIADCPRQGEARSPVPPRIVDAGTQVTAKAATDETLVASWMLLPGGERRVLVQWLRDGDWQDAVDLVVAAER